MNIGKKLNRDFYTKDTLGIARELLGKIFVKKYGDLTIAGKIVETEAYIGACDESAHSFNGRTNRNKVMFYKGGYLYVYLIYGIHYCLNVVTGIAGEGNAVLIRALEPLHGIELMLKNRYSVQQLNTKKILNLTNGPAKICKSFSITTKQNGSDLLKSEISIHEELHFSGKPEIKTSQRIGIKKSVDLPWRFYLKGNRFVSKK